MKKILKGALLVTCLMAGSAANANRQDQPWFKHRPACYLRLDAGMFGTFYALVPCNIGESAPY